MKQLYLYGCKGYASNLFAEKLNLDKSHIRLLTTHIPSGESGIINDIQFTKDIPKKNEYVLCKIMGTTPNPLVSFVIHGKTIYVSWGKTPCKTAQRWRTIRKTKKECQQIKRRHVPNIYKKLDELTTHPTLKLLHEIFGYDKSYLYPGNKLESIINNFKNATPYFYTMADKTHL
jgi:hypothetical protein